MEILKLDNIKKSYQDGENEKIVLDGANLNIASGEFVAILGPSGCGKSTLLSIAGLLLSQDDGKIFLKGQEINPKNQKERTKLRRDRLGFIFQNHELIPYLNVYDQLDMIMDFKDKDRKNHREKIENALNNLGIGDCINKYPQKMSGGQKQRAAIARAFLNQPDLILADEPTASLDQERAQQIVKLIQKEVKEKNRAALMVTHDHSLLDSVDTIYQIKNAKLEKLIV